MNIHLPLDYLCVCLSRWVRTIIINLRVIYVQIEFLCLWQKKEQVVSLRIEKGSKRIWNAFDSRVLYLRIDSSHFPKRKK